MGEPSCVDYDKCPAKDTASCSINCMRYLWDGKTKARTSVTLAPDGISNNFAGYKYQRFKQRPMTKNQAKKERQTRRRK